MGREAQRVKTDRVCKSCQGTLKFCTAQQLLEHTRMCKRVKALGLEMVKPVNLVEVK